MESVGRVTRSKARALGTTPIASIPTKPEPKTTGRRRKGAAQVQEQQVEETAPKQLQFSEEPPAEEQVPADRQLAATENSKKETLAGQFALGSTASAEPKQRGDDNMHSETHEGPSALKISLNSKEQQPTAANLEAAPLELERAASLVDAGEFLQPAAGSPVSNVGISPMTIPSLIDTSAMGLAMDARLLSSFTSPKQADQSSFPGAMSPMSVESSLLSGRTEVGPLDGVAKPSDQTSTPCGANKSDALAIRNQLGFNSDVPRNDALAIPQRLVTSISASPLSLSAEVIDAAVFSPMPEDDFLDSPISLSGAQVEELEYSQDGDEMMADATTSALGAPSAAFTFAGLPSDSVLYASASPVPTDLGFQGFASVLMTPAGPELENSPSLAGLLSVTGPSPSKFLVTDGVNAANGATASPTVKALTTPLGVESRQYDVTAPFSTVTSPVVDVSLLLAPAPTPESGALPGWRLAQTPLVSTLSASLADVALDQCEAVSEPDSEVDSGNLVQGRPQEYMPLTNTDTEMDDELSLQATALLSAPTVRQVTADVSTEAVIPALLLQGRSPVARHVFQNAATPAPGKTTHKAAAPAARSDLVTVESKYNKTPTVGATAARPRPSIATAATKSGALTPVGFVNAAHGGKSMKRVSIHTPEGLRSAVPHRHVVPTPFRPKFTVKSPEPSVVVEAFVDQSSAAVVEPPEDQSLNSQTSNAANGWRDKAAEWTEHASVVAPAPSFAMHLHSPGPLAPTQDFAVKASVKAMKSMVDAGGYNHRSLRQLRRDVKEAAARKAAKAALIEARAAKLTPKVPERQLPMPDDDEGSDDQAVYNEGQENELVAAMSGLEVAPVKDSVPMPLRGLPAPQGRHVRFNEIGNVSESPQRTVLRGLPVATGKYIRFD